MPSTHLPETFSLLCWNVHKEMERKRFKETFHLLQQHYNPDLILLQEAVLNAHTSKQFPLHSYETSANIETWRRAFGVLTAAQSSLHKQLSQKTIHRELHMTTRKSLLITTHPFENEKIVSVVNLHAINFVPISIFVKEIDRLLLTLWEIKGPIIVAGDFNTWNNKRLIHLEKFAEMMGLSPAILEDKHHVKQLFSKPLDHLFYRDLKLIEASAIDTKRVSDHNPIFARFEMI